jgi:hypothetical protein
MTTYQVVVVAIGKAASGNSLPSTAIPVMPASVPAAPTGVQATLGARSLTATFTPGDPGSGVLSYTATATGGSTPLTCTVATTAAPCVITGLTPGTSYTVTVVANSVVLGLTSAVSAPAAPVVAVNAAAATLPTAQPASGGSLISSAGTALRVNGLTTLTGTGWAPFTGISVGIYPGPVSLGTAVTDSTGSFSLSVAIPSGTTVGTHVIVAGGLLTTNALRYKTLGTTISAAIQPLAMQRSAADQDRPVAGVRRTHLAMR